MYTAAEAIRRDPARSAAGARSPAPSPPPGPRCGSPDACLTDAHGDAEGGDRSGRGRLRRRPPRPPRPPLPRYVDDGRLPGWLVAVSRHGQLAHVGTYGQRDVEAGLPVETDTIWRIYSMTKPITAVAALIAVGAGRLRAQRPGPPVHPVVRRPARVARRLGGAPGDRAGHRGDAGLAPLHPHERPDLRVHAGPPRRRALPPGRLRVGRARPGSTSPACATASPRCRCCSSRARSGTTA